TNQAMIRMDPYAMHDDKPCFCIGGLSINGEELVAGFFLQVHWITHDNAWGNLIGPFFLPGIVGSIGEVRYNQQQQWDDITHRVLYLLSVGYLRRGPRPLLIVSRA